MSTPVRKQEIPLAYFSTLKKKPVLKVFWRFRLKDRLYHSALRKLPRYFSLSHLTEAWCY